MDSSGALGIWFGVILVATCIDGRRPSIQPQHGRFARQFLVSTSEQLQGFFHHGSCGRDPFGLARGSHAQPNQHQGHPHVRPLVFVGACIHRERRVVNRFDPRSARNSSFPSQTRAKTASSQDDPRTEPAGAIPTLLSQPYGNSGTRIEDVSGVLEESR